METASPIKKNLVIIIDRSGSMSGPRMRLAVDAALTVLDTLSPQDYVSITIHNATARKTTLTKVIGIRRTFSNFLSRLIRKL